MNPDRLNLIAALFDELGNQFREAADEASEAPAPTPTPAPEPEVPGEPSEPGPEPSPEPEPEPSPSPEEPSPEEPLPDPSEPPTTPPPGPTPAPSPQPTTNEPSGLAIINDRHFRSVHPKYDSVTGNNPQYARPGDLPLAEGWSKTEGMYLNFSSVDDGSAPSGDGKAGQMRYPAGMRSGVGPATSTLVLPPGLTELYIAIWMKLSHNWVGNDSSTNKMFFVGHSGGNNQFFFSAEGRRLGRLIGQSRTQGLFETRKRFLPEGGPAEILRGVWHQLEFFLKANSAPQKADGWLYYWLDGVPIVTKRDINWTEQSRPSTPVTWSILNWNPTYGGGGPGIPYNDVDTTINGVFTPSRASLLLSETAVVPEFAIIPGDHAQFLRFDRVYVSGR